MKAFHYCQHCGNLSLPRAVRLTPKQRQILELVLRRTEIGSEQLCAALSIARKTLHVHISQMNLELANHGMAVRADLTGYRFYRLIAEAA